MPTSASSASSRAQGQIGSTELVSLIRDGDERLPELARENLAEVADVIEAVEAKIAQLDAKLVIPAQANEMRAAHTAPPWPIMRSPPL